jgi:hypothetical protein
MGRRAWPSGTVRFYGQPPAYQPRSAAPTGDMANHCANDLATRAGPTRSWPTGPLALCGDCDRDSIASGTQGHRPPQGQPIWPCGPCTGLPLATVAS